jgi:hypothetical protein
MGLIVAILWEFRPFSSKTSGKSNLSCRPSSNSFVFRPSARCDICAPYTLAYGPLELIVDWFSTAVDRRHLSTFSGMDSHILPNVTYLLKLFELSSLAFAKENCN